MATNSNVSFYADVWQHVQKSVWLLKDGRSVQGWSMKEHCFPKTWMGESNCDICSDSRLAVSMFHDLEYLSDIPYHGVHGYGY